MTEWLLLLAAVVLTVFTGFFVAAEFSLTTVDRGRAEEAAAAGDSRGRSVVRALKTLSTQLSAAQFGITITTLVVGYLAEPSIGRLLHGPLESLGLPAATATAVAFALAIGLATTLQMLLGELGPKNLAIAEPMAVAAFVAPGMRAFSRVTGPVVGTLQRVSNWIVRRLGFEPREELETARGADELVSVARRSAEEGDLSPVAARLLQRSLGLDGKLASDVMTPRTGLWTLRASATAAEIIAAAVESGNSRFPVYGSDLDEVTGVVHVKHAVSVPEEERDRRTAGELAVPVLAVPSSLQLHRLLDLLRDQGLQLALVVDEWGATHGVVTLEDIVEELVGEIADETDRPLRTLSRVDGDTWVVAGLLRPDEVFERTGVRVPEGRYETVAGFLAEELQRLPEPGDTVSVEGAELTVESVEGRRVARVRVHRLEQPEGDDAPADLRRQEVPA